MKIIFLGLLILISQAGSAQNTIEYSTIDLEKVYSGDEVDTPARFQDGKEDFPEIRTLIHYPKDAREKGISGKVMITVIVERDGTLTNTKVTKHVYPSLDAEALRAALLIRSKMKPAEIKGIAVRSEYTFPIVFYLQ